MVVDSVPRVTQHTPGIEEKGGSRMQPLHEIKRAAGNEVALHDLPIEITEHRKLYSQLFGPDAV